MVFAKLDKINRKEKINSNDTYTFEIQTIQLCLQKNKMVGHKTFTIIKPDAFKASYAGPIIEIIENAGFKIKNMRLVEMDNIMVYIRKGPSLQDYVITCAQVQLL